MSDYQCTIDEWENFLKIILSRIIEKSREGRPNVVELNRILMFDALDDFILHVCRHYNCGSVMPSPKLLSNIKPMSSSKFTPHFSSTLVKKGPSNGRPRTSTNR